MDDQPCYELRGGKWTLAKMSDEEPSAIVVYATEPSPETGHVGWCWWAQGKMGDAPSLDAAKASAESALKGGE